MSQRIRFKENSELEPHKDKPRKEYIKEKLKVLKKELKKSVDIRDGVEIRIKKLDFNKKIPSLSNEYMFAVTIEAYYSGEKVNLTTLNARGEVVEANPFIYPNPRPMVPTGEFVEIVDTDGETKTVEVCEEDMQEALFINLHKKVRQYI